MDEKAIDLPNSVLPMRVVDNDNHVIETTVCDSISGGQDEICGMPRTVGLMRTRDGHTTHAMYIFASVIDDQTDLPQPSAVIFTVKANGIVLYEGPEEKRAREQFEYGKSSGPGKLVFESRTIICAVNL